MRRVRIEGRKAAIAASVLALVGLGTGGVFLAVALAAPAKPPAPVITASPTNPTTSSSATFSFTDSQAGVTFKCSRDGAAFSTCSSGTPYSGLAQGNHTFSVEALSGSNTSNVTTYSWAIAPPSPTILTHPASPTGATSAAFTFSDTQSGVGFKCALDTGSFSNCTSGKNYSGLAGGTHTFAVKAQVGSNPPSVPASFGWTIDLTAPTITITFPANGGTDNNTLSGWAGGCVPLGICGTSSDTPAGVQSVAVALRQLSSGKYWNGSSFSSNSIVFNATTGTPTVWKYAKALPADGQYTVLVRAIDNFGNVTASGDLKTATFTIDTVAPAAPAIVDGPTNPSKDKSPEFEFTDRKNQVVFTCKLDTGATTTCTGDTDHDGDNHGEHNRHADTSTFGEIQYGTLTPGPHCFYVYATDPAANVGPTTTYCWTISGTTTTNTITPVTGTPQTATAGGTFAAPLVAKVTDSSSNPVAGVSVTFAAPTIGASGTFASAGCTSNSPTSTCTVTTNASGIATSSAFTANSATGSYTVTATATGVVTPANFSLTNATVLNFHISGNMPTSLYPGTSRPLTLTITNPNASPITIPVNGITVAVATTQAGCGNGNFAGSTGPVAPVNVASGATITLSGLSVSMIETHTNQDACRNAPLTLTYSGTASGS